MFFHHDFQGSTTDLGELVIQLLAFIDHVISDTTDLAKLARENP